MPLIEVRRLGKTYGDEIAATVALREVSFDIEEGEFVAIMGPSGSGKSTLLHMLGFLDEPTAGEYLFRGKRSTVYSKEEVARVRNEEMGFVFQAFNLLARTSVLENVKLPLLYSRRPEKEWQGLAMRAVEAVGLEHRLDHQPSELSGGEKQRVAIARALVLSPKVIFADEPTGNLDSKSGQLVMATIQRLNEEFGHTIILITHETETAEHAHRIIHVKDGEIERDEQVSHRRKRSQFAK